MTTQGDSRVSCAFVPLCYNNYKTGDPVFLSIVSLFLIVQA